MNATATAVKTGSSGGWGCGCASCGGGGGGKKSGTSCTCKQKPCAQCDGMVAQFERPLFFGGQLLTSDDLQALINYVVDKSRLHNRMLFGDGVVCGLQVVCDPCSDRGVIVKPGYALDCCGNDIVVPCEYELDIISMIRDLRRDALGGRDCGDPCPPPMKTGTTAHQTSSAAQQTKLPVRYDLYVKSCEERTDPVMPFDQGDECSGSPCSETRIREGFGFELRCAPVPAIEDVKTLSTTAFVNAVGAPDRLASFADKMIAIKDAIAKQIVVAHEDFEQTRLGLAALLQQENELTDCELLRELQAYEFGKDDLQNFNHLRDVSRRLLLVKDCKRWLIDCAPCDDDAVLLARIEAQDCKVIRICNYVRTPVITGPFLWAWDIGSRYERETVLCCAPMRLLRSTQALVGASAPTPAGPAVPLAAAAPPGAPATPAVVSAGMRDADLIKGLFEKLRALDVLPADGRIEDIANSVRDDDPAELDIDGRVRKLEHQLAARDAQIDKLSGELSEALARFDKLLARRSVVSKSKQP